MLIRGLQDTIEGLREKSNLLRKEFARCLGEVGDRGLSRLWCSAGTARLKARLIRVLFFIA